MRDVVFIVGMGRSGSSALARVLGLCGGALPTTVLAPNFANPTGYWEPEAALDLNERFLAQHESSWYDPAITLQMHPVTGGDRASFVAQAVRVLSNGFAPDGPIVFKEPRIAGLLPYWIAAAHAAGLTPKIVHNFRQPRDVAASLAHRDELVAEQSDALWLKYNLIAERDGRGLPRVFVGYEELMNDWKCVVERCAHGLGLRLDLSASAQDAVSAFLSAELHHHRSPPEDTSETGDRLELRTYRILEDAARTGRSDDAAFDGLLAEFTFARGVVGRPGPNTEWPSAIHLEARRIRQVFVHCYIMKNGGSTIQRVLRREFGHSLYEIHRENDDGRIAPRELAALLHAHPDARAVASHHFMLQLPEIADMALFTCCPVREPLERLGSLYRYFRTAGGDDDLGRLARELDLGAFLRTLFDRAPHYVFNVQTALFANGGRFRPLHERHAADAVATMERLDVNVVVDRMDESLTVAEYFLGHAFPGLQLHYVAMNRTASIDTSRRQREAELREQCGDELFAQLRRANAFDRHLFACADAELDRRIALVPDFGGRLADLRRRSAQARDRVESSGL